MAKYLDPKVDILFKKIFGEHENLCISLLNALLPLEDPIESITYQPANILPDIPFLKESIVDVHCVDGKQRQFIVEMQMQWTNSFMSRVLFNASKVYVHQLKKGDPYELLYPVYSVNFVNQTFSRNTEEFYHYYKVVNIADTEEQIKGLEFLFLELPKFKPKNMLEKKMAVLWLKFLTETKDYSIPSELLEEPETREAVELLEESSCTLEELEMYDRNIDAIRTGRMFINDALAEGMEKGLAEGRAEGEIKRHEDKLEMARVLMSSGVSVEIIINATGLSKEEIERL
jgi:predicted transposase/invertase (TIGR01784 family)